MEESKDPKEDDQNFRKLARRSASAPKLNVLTNDDNGHLSEGTVRPPPLSKRYVLMHNPVHTLRERTNERERRDKEVCSVPLYFTHNTSPKMEALKLGQAHQTQGMTVCSCSDTSQEKTKRPSPFKDWYVTCFGHGPSDMFFVNQRRTSFLSTQL